MAENLQNLNTTFYTTQTFSVDKFSTLRNAILKGNDKEVKVILKSTSKAHLTPITTNLNSYGESLLFIAVSTCKIKTIILMIKKGFKHSQKNQINETIFHKAVSKGKINIIKLLLKQFNIDVNSVNKFKMSGFVIACCSQRKDISTYLIKKGAFIDQTDIVGNTVLHLAYCYNYHEMIRFLIAIGVDKNIKNNKNKKYNEITVEP